MWGEFGLDIGSRLVSEPTNVPMASYSQISSAFTASTVERELKEHMAREADLRKALQVCNFGCAWGAFGVMHAPKSFFYLSGQGQSIGRFARTIARSRSAIGGQDAGASTFGE